MNAGDVGKLKGVGALTVLATLDGLVSGATQLFEALGVVFFEDRAFLEKAGKVLGKISQDELDRVALKRENILLQKLQTASIEPRARQCRSGQS